MRLLSMFGFLLTLSAGAAQLRTGSAESNGVWVNYETRLEPPSPPIYNHGGGVLTEKNIIKRHICNFDNNTYFGYDLTVEKLGGKYRFRFGPLTITPELMSRIFNKVPRWTALQLPGGEVVMDVRAGETVALDLFVNTSTGQRVTEYLTVKGSDRPQLSISGPARDFTAADAEIAISAPRVTVDGKEIATWNGAMSGNAVWVDLPGYGRYVFSLAPRPDLGMQRAGEIRGVDLKWRMSGHEFAISTRKPVTTGSSAYHLYVGHVRRSVDDFGISAGSKPDDPIGRRRD